MAKPTNDQLHARKETSITTEFVWLVVGTREYIAFFSEDDAKRYADTFSVATVIRIRIR